MTAIAPAIPPAATEPDRRIGRLNRASSARPVEPDTHLPWGTPPTRPPRARPAEPHPPPPGAPRAPGRVLPADLQSSAGLGGVAGLPLALPPARGARLSREEVAAMLTMGTHFEATLMSGF